MPRMPNYSEHPVLVSGKNTSSSATETDSESESESGRNGRRTGRRGFITVEEALKPLHPSIKSDSNSWPCFALQDATVYLKDGTTVTNLLEAETAGPFVVTGRLDLDEEDEYYSYLRKRQYRDSYVKIQNVSGYSFGDRSDEAFCREAGHAIIWAGSEAFGWFEISPSLKYEPYVTRMNTAINAYWFLQSFYRKKRAASIPIEEVVARYTVQAEGSGNTRLEAQKVLLDNASFLISQMRRKEGVDFEKTIFWNWLVASSPTVVTALQKLKVAIVLPKLVPSVPFKHIPHPPRLDDEAQSTRGEDDDDNENDDKESASITGDDIYTDSVDRPKTNAEWIIWAMNGMVSSGEIKKERISAAKVWLKVFLVFTCSTAGLAREIVRVHAAEVREKIGTSWRNTTAFKELGEWDPLIWNAKDSPEWRKKALSHHLKLRATQSSVQGGQRQRARRNASGVDATNKDHDPQSASASDSQFRGNHGPSASGRRTRGFTSQGVSSTELLTTKAAIKARVDAERENITSGEGVEPPSKKKGRSRLAGKIATLHPPGTNKRVLSAALEDEEEDSRYKKRTRSSVSSSRASSESSDPTSSNSNDPYAEDDQTSPTDPNYPGAAAVYESSPFHHEALDLDKEGGHHLVLSSTPIRTLRANTRNGGWKCDLPTSSTNEIECHFAIYDITTPTAQAAFTKHCYDHASGILTSANLTSSSAAASGYVNASASRSIPPSSTSLPGEAGVAGEQMALLVAAEAAKTGHKVSHLVEKLMALNRVERAEEEAEEEIIDGKKVPKRIKRLL